MTKHRVCCVVDQFCLNPANGEQNPILIMECYVCGLKVCKNCSVRRTYHAYGVKRICHNCLEQEDGNDSAVMAHLTKQAKA